ncbi:TetR/AcrR family transcriptional regulator [bacterium]|nr:MAG: TetR/AcrR family transcriptional regulator [bacterium]
MARPKAFNRDAALQAAMALFWKQGYEATSTDDLLKAMGIGRQSLYDTFGDKHRLYLEALELYNSSRVAEHGANHSDDASPLAALEAILFAIADADPAAHAIGCMGINAICEFGQSDPAVAAISHGSNEQMLTTLEGILRAAKAKGEVAANLDEKQAAQFISAILAGMKVREKAGDDTQQLRAVATFALDSLRAS